MTVILSQSTPFSFGIFFFLAFSHSLIGKNKVFFEYTTVRVIWRIAGIMKRRRGSKQCGSRNRRGNSPEAGMGSRLPGVIPVQL